MAANSQPIQLDAKGALKAASTMMQAFYGQRIAALKQLESGQDKIMSEKLSKLWEKVAQVSDSPMQAVIIFASLLIEELDRRITIVVT